MSFNRHDRFVRSLWRPGFEGMGFGEKTAVDRQLKLSQLYLAERNGKKAAGTAGRGLALSPYEEEAYRLAMQADLMMGKYNHVLRTYRALKERLCELHIQPSALTRQLYDQ